MRVKAAVMVARSRRFRRRERGKRAVSAMENRPNAAT
jgi:hypothetical protein